MEHQLKCLGKKGSSDLLGALIQKSRGYKQLRASLIEYDLTLSSRTLSIRLKEFQDLNLIEREVKDTNPTRSIYSLTDKGKIIKELLDTLEKI